MMRKLFSEWETLNKSHANERTFQRHRKKLKLGVIRPIETGGIGYYLTEKEFNQILRSMGR